MLALIDKPIQFMFTTFAVEVAFVHVTIPVMMIMLAAALAHIDRDYVKAAESLGAGPIRAFLTVTLPLSMPGIIAGVTTAFAWTFSAFATPQLIGGGRVNMVSNLVYQLGFASFNFPFAASLCVAGLVLTVSADIAAADRRAAAGKDRTLLTCRARAFSGCWPFAERSRCWPCSASSFCRSSSSRWRRSTAARCRRFRRKACRCAGSSARSAIRTFRPAFATV